MTILRGRRKYNTNTAKWTGWTLDEDGNITSKIRLIMQKEQESINERLNGVCLVGVQTPK